MDHSDALALDPSSPAGVRRDTLAAHDAAATSAPDCGLPSAGPDVLDAGAFYRGLRRTGLQYGPAFRVVLRARADGSAALLRCRTRIECKTPCVTKHARGHFVMQCCPVVRMVLHARADGSAAVPWCDTRPTAQLPSV